MLMQDLYGPSDFLNLTNDDIKDIKKNLESEFPSEVDVCDYLYNNMQIYSQNDVVKQVISNKIFAGQVSIKWYKFRYIRGLTKEKLKEKLESADLGYDTPFKKRDIDNIENDIVGICKDGNVYTLKLMLLDGKKRYSDGINIQTMKVKKPIIVKIDVERKWIEVRAKEALCAKVIGILERKLGIVYHTEVNVLRKFANNIHVFKDSLIDAFWNTLKANPSENIELTEEDRVAVMQIMAAVDEFFNDKEQDVSIKGKALIESLTNVDIDLEGLKLEEIILAGVDHLTIKVRDDSERDLGGQTLYSLIKDDVLGNTGYIRFSNIEGGKQYTMLVGKSSNSISFKTSVSEDVIEYIRNKVL